jgi:hypothetical protein
MWINRNGEIIGYMFLPSIDAAQTAVVARQPSFANGNLTRMLFWLDQYTA